MMMMPDFFSKSKCDRCNKPLEGTRMQSWFTEEVLCSSGAGNCIDKESKLKNELANLGHDTRQLEGCGYIPTATPSMDFITEK